MDILARIAAEESGFTPALEKKLRAITKSGRHVVRVVSEDEFAELGGEDDWFMFRKRQCVVKRRDNGQIVVWAM